MPIFDPFKQEEPAEQEPVKRKAIIDPFKQEEPAERKPIADPFADPVIDQYPEVKKKAIDALVYSQEMGIDPKTAYDAHDIITKKLAERGVSFNDNPIYEAQKKTPGSFIGPAPSRSLIGKIAERFRTRPEVSRARAANVMALSDAYGITPAEAEDEYDWLVREENLRGNPTGKEIIEGTGEAVVSLATGSVATLAGGLFSVRSLLAGKPEQSEESMRRVSEFLTYQPRGAMGQMLTEAGGAPFTMFHYMAPIAGDYVLEKTGSPNLAATTATVVESVPVMAMAAGPGKAAMLKIRKTNLWRKATIKERGVVVRALEQTVSKNPRMSEAEIFKKSEDYFQEVVQRRDAIKEAKAESAVAAAEAMEAGAPPVEMPDVKAPDVPLARAIVKLKKAESVREAHNIPPIKNMVAAKTGLTNTLKRDTLLPEVQKLRYIDGVRRAKKPEDMMAISDKIMDSLKIAGKRRDVQNIIRAKKLQKVDNLREAMKYPSPKKMTAEQLQKFETELQPFQKGDVFLSQRILETIDRTELKGVKTLREVRETFAKRTGIPVDMRGKIVVGKWDRWLSDTPLAKQSPFHRVMIEDFHKVILEADAKFYQFEEVSNALATKARASRERTLSEKLIPTDELIFDYLSSPDKKAIAKRMTPEEIDYAIFLEDKFAEALTYLIETEALKTGRENYITNLRRDFFETAKESGVKQAFKEILEQQRLDEQTFSVRDELSGEILGLDKFFKFAIPRSGELTPTKNVARAASTYFKTLERKKALDSYTPKIMAFADALSEMKTKNDVPEINAALKTFVKEWINTKKGKPAKGFIPVGSAVDRAFGVLKTATTLLDLGGNIPVQVASVGGEAVAVFSQMGAKARATAKRRLKTTQGKKIIEEHKNIIGKTLFDELTDASNSFGDKAATALFGGFKLSATRSNKIQLLGNLTEAEFRTGKIDPGRLSQIKLAMGETRAIPGLGSIVGSTREAQLASQYKGFAIPILNTYGPIIKKLGEKAARKGTKLTDKEAFQLRNAIYVTGAAYVALQMIPDDDTSFMGKLTAKVKREAMTIIGAMDPQLFFGEPRTISFIKEFGEVITDTLTLSEYGEKSRKKLRGKSKAITKTKRMLTPRAVKQFETKQRTRELKR